MWRRELATKTTTADATMGSHSKLSSVMATSLWGDVP
jgi:hypothetical protein